MLSTESEEKIMTQKNAPNFNRKVDWALYLAHAGFTVIPVLPDTKTPAAKWEPWESNQTDEQIQSHWKKYPHHDVGIISNSELIVFDADGEQSLKALQSLEEKHALTPACVVKTRKGEHHYFLRPKDVFARQDSHSTKLHPAKIDVKTNRSLIIGPGSVNKEILIWTVEHRCHLTPVSQNFVDEVFTHNQRDVPRPFLQELQAKPDDEFSDRPTNHVVLRELVKHCDPNDYDTWIRVGTALHHETGGSAEGMAIFNKWSEGGESYKGLREIEYKWRSFRSSVGRPSTVGTLIHYAKQAGANIDEIRAMGEDAFTPCETEVIHRAAFAPSRAPVESPSQQVTVKVGSPLGKFSLRDRLLEIEQHAQAQIPILGSLVIYGQASVIYGQPNTGKTVITLHLLIEDIKAGVIDAENLYYLNMDDNSNGLIEKLRLAQEHGFHMLADGHEGFSAEVFRKVLVTMVESDAAKGVIVVLDTLTKFVNTMDKLACRAFATLIRQFVLKGGTVIALAHTNKNPGADGQPVYAGVTDIVNDFDCMHILSTVSQQADGNQKVVEFNNRKRRGSNVLTASFSYALERNISYEALLLSVQSVDPDAVTTLKAREELANDFDVIKVVKTCIAEGVTTKMNLAAEVAKRSGVSRRAALDIIEKYTGADIEKHHWNFAVKDRGAKVYHLLLSTTPLN
jgi:Primase C terminal 2 (PriCT-2)/Bifunctional DNA primase/polymerase, N-terminal